MFIDVFLCHSFITAVEYQGGIHDACSSVCVDLIGHGYDGCRDTGLGIEIECDGDVLRIFVGFLYLTLDESLYVIIIYLDQISTNGFVRNSVYVRFADIDPQSVGIPFLEDGFILCGRFLRGGEWYRAYGCDHDSNYHCG